MTSPGPAGRQFLGTVLAKCVTAMMVRQPRPASAFLEESEMKPLEILYDLDDGGPPIWVTVDGDYCACVAGFAECLSWFSRTIYDLMLSGF